MPETAVQTSAERVEKDRVKLRVEVPETVLDPAIDAVYRRWSNDIKIPGFRKGKVPRRLIDSRVGPDVIRREALRDALPDLYEAAMRKEDLEAIAPPDIDVVEFEQGAPLVFEAVVDVRPEVHVPDLAAITVEAPSSEVTDQDLDEHLERLRDRFAELETVSREARVGDYVLIDLRGHRNDELVEGAGAPDFLYELGSGTGPPKLDDEIRGARAGSILKFNDRVPEGGGPAAGQEISFTVLVKEVKAKKLPVLDDEFAKTAGEFETLEELKKDLREGLASVKKTMVEEELRSLCVAALVDGSDLEPPEKLVEDEFNHRLEHFEADLKRAGLTLESYGRQAQLTELEIRRDIRLQTARSVKAELLLEQVAREQQIEVTREDIGRQIALMAGRSGRELKEVAQEVAGGGRLNAVAADIMRAKALDYVVEHMNVLGREKAAQQGSIKENPE